MQTPLCRINQKGFTVLELMVGILIFTLGFLGAYLLVNSANNTAIRSKDEIIAANIMREQIELLKNLRDTNWIQFRSWDSIDLAKPLTEIDTVLQPNTFYTIGNNFSLNKKIYLKKLINFSNNKEAIVSEFQKTNSSIRLCIDTLGRYTYNCTQTDQKTNYASFLQIEPLVTKNTLTNTLISVEKSYKVTVFFASLNKGYYLTSMSTIITDWKTQ
ncbi:MAG: prepilin-type N-terminal cleavage/methylation domain-containing protein [Candidatus Gracilibacteria bacterium]|nr:prepilin-type N-terminal cleavage/methylation domain-containing protein [Candidatus Gracilibacteria bacterium]